MKKYFLILFLFCKISYAMTAGEPITVPYVDLPKYMGTWYEIARFPQRFEKNCTAVTATYQVRLDGDVDVVNQCHLGTINGKLKKSRAKAWVVNKETNAKLKVQFFWPFAGKYWVIDLDENYEYAVVGHPNRKYLWVLYRHPHMPDELYSQITQRIREKGYDLTLLEKTIQP